MTTVEIVHLSAQVPKDLRDELRALAQLHDRSVSAEVRRALEAHVKHSRAEAA